jgi:cation:H+ antiporter
MPSWLDIVLLALGALILGYSGGRLVDFASAIAERFRLTPAVIGLTVVAGGTSAPELVVSLTAALRGSSDLALGNVLGSNIANLGLILGVCAWISPVPIARSVLRFEYPFLLLASWVSLLLLRDGRLDRLESAFFLASIIAFTAYSVQVARREATAGDKALIAEVVPQRAAALSRRPGWLLSLAVLLALGGLSLGAHMLVAGALGLARAAGMSERVVGLTVVALGTSLPELAFTIAAALKKQQEMAVSNVLGSNVFNLLMILGATGLLRPIHVDPRTATLDVWVMLVLTLLLFPLVFRGRNLSRPAGVGLVAAYGGYLLWLAALAP